MSGNASAAKCPVRLSIVYAAMAVLVSVAAYGGTLSGYERVRAFAEPRQIDDTEFVDHNGNPFRIKELHGRVALIFFGFTNCPDVCPITLARWREFEMSGQVDLEKTAFVLVSVDGERDTPAVMKNYLANFSENFIGLTAAPSKVKIFAKQFSAPFFKGGASSHEGHYDVAHSQQAFVLDPNGLLRAEFYDPAIDTMADVVNTILAESRNADADIDPE